MTSTKQAPFCAKMSDAPLTPEKINMSTFGTACTVAVSQADAEEPVFPAGAELPAEALACINAPGIEAETRTSLRSAFVTMFGTAAHWMAEAAVIRVTDASQVADMARAKEIRLKLKGIRCDGEATRKRLKADSLAKGRAIDGIANVLKDQIEPAEKWLQEQEEFAERQKQKAIDALRIERQALLAPFVTDPVAASQGVDLAYMMPEAFAAMLEGAKMQAEIREHTRRREEEDRQAAEAKRLEQERANEAERKRLQEENARLQAEQRQKDAENAKLKAEAAEAERQRLAKEQEEKAAAEAEAARLAEIASKAASAPDKEKALVFAATLMALAFPEMSSPKGKRFGVRMGTMVIELAGKIKELANREL
jgi:hypothetical protein